MSTPHYHAVVWLDHHEARVIHFSADAADETTIHPDHPPRHLHATAGAPAGHHTTGEDSFYRDVLAALSPAHLFLVAGPSTAKQEFVKFLEKHAPDALPRLAGVETLPHVSDNQLVADARHFFKAADRMRPQRG